MKRKIKNIFTPLINAVFIYLSISPIAYAAQPASTGIIIKIIKALLGVFQGAGVILLAYSMIALILALKDENVDNKVQATTQIAVSVVCITLPAILETLSEAANVNMTLT